MTKYGMEIVNGAKANIYVSQSVYGRVRVAIRTYAGYAITYAIRPNADGTFNMTRRMWTTEGHMLTKFRHIRKSLDWICYYMEPELRFYREG